MIAHIICMNDGTSAVVLDDEEKALKEMQRLSDEYYKVHKWNFKSLEDYKRICYWHLHGVPVIE